MHPHMHASSRIEANQALYGRVNVHVSDPHASTQEGQLLFLHRRAQTIAGGAELFFLGGGFQTWRDCCLVSIFVCDVKSRVWERATAHAHARPSGFKENHHGENKELP